MLSSVGRVRDGEFNPRHVFGGFNILPFVGDSVPNASVTRNNCQRPGGQSGPISAFAFSHFVIGVSFEDYPLDSKILTC
jgi:hypothetical protein